MAEKNILTIGYSSENSDNTHMTMNRQFFFINQDKNIDDRGYYVCIEFPRPSYSIDYDFTLMDSCLKELLLPGKLKST